MSVPTVDTSILVACIFPESANTAVGPGTFQVMAGVNEFDVGEAMPASHRVAMAFDL